MTKKLRMAFGENLKRYRKLSGLTQKELAERLNISVSQVSKMEQGTVGASFEILEKLEKVFALPADILIRR